jgi:hypothetical protein
VAEKKIRTDFVREQLHELNDEDYQLVIEVIEKAASPKQHIEKKDRLEKVRYRLNNALEHEGWEVTRDGVVRPIEHEEER